ncbi:WD40 repeat domain-containing protein [Nonomuraea dietziae]|uniref:WD40 repeat domain-containing protein n=2 Tax=Nonomuraea dietziae TaxID=65515 RepID=A0A7W5VPF4_9ACTN|nr:WD40 repeat domain-containing protein [Nonomuraea dietziae]MBB3731867.1 hypothetical protein [Nonomuraea dietziae]
MNLRRAVAMCAASCALLPLIPASASAARLDENEIDTGLGVTLHERPGDPKKVTAIVGAKPHLRTADDTFEVVPGYFDVAVAPKGHRVAGLPENPKGRYDSVAIIDAAAQQTTTVRTSKLPFRTTIAYWSASGSKLALTVEKTDGKKWLPVGFATADVRAKAAKVVLLKDLSKDAVFQWTPDGRHLMSSYRDGVRFYRPDGKVVRTLPGVGSDIGGETAFSPSGKLLGTFCPARYYESFCTWDLATGKLRNRVDIAVEGSYGWWDDKHLLAAVKGGSGYQMVVVDLKGNVVRTVADISSSAWKKDEVYLSYTDAG